MPVKSTSHALPGASHTRSPVAAPASRSAASTAKTMESLSPPSLPAMRVRLCDMPMAFPPEPAGLAWSDGRSKPSASGLARRGGPGHPCRVLQPPPLRLQSVELGALGADLLRGHALDVAIVELPVGMVAPAQRRLNRRARHRRGFEQAQRQLQRERLRGGVVRLARRVTEREVGEEKARHARMLD